MATPQPDTDEALLINYRNARTSFYMAPEMLVGTGRDGQLRMDAIYDHFVATYTALPDHIRAQYDPPPRQSPAVAQYGVDYRRGPRIPRGQRDERCPVM